MSLWPLKFIVLVFFSIILSYLLVMYTVRLQKLPGGVSLRYKIIVIRHGKKVSSQKFKEVLGYYNKDSNIIKVKMDSLYHWLGKGAILSTPVYKLLGNIIKL